MNKKHYGTNYNATVPSQVVDNLDTKLQWDFDKVYSC